MLPAQDFPGKFNCQLPHLSPFRNKMRKKLLPSGLQCVALSKLRRCHRQTTLRSEYRPRVRPGMSLVKGPSLFWAVFVWVCPASQKPTLQPSLLLKRPDIDAQPQCPVLQYFKHRSLRRRDIRPPDGAAIHDRAQHIAVVCSSQRRCGGSPVRPRQCRQHRQAVGELTCHALDVRAKAQLRVE
eukprot:gene3459-biopygen11263